MTKNSDLLFEPFISEKLQLPNRIVMAPMTRSFSPGGIPGEDVAAYYRKRAEAEVGLIVTEGTTVDYDTATNDINVPEFVSDAAIAGWKRVVEEVHAAGGKIAPQLWHMGMARGKEVGPAPEQASIGPSGLVAPGKKVSDPMTMEQIEEVVAKFANAAEKAKEIGFDAVEVHGAHGYLVDQFFWEGTNQRDDEYGGSLLKRTRFAVEIVKAIRAKVGNDFPIIFRFSQWKLQDYEAKLANSSDELAQFLAPLVDAGVDIFHASTRRYWLPEFDGSPLNLAGWTQKITGKPAITVGCVGLDDEFIKAFSGGGALATNIDPLLEQLQRGDYDLVAVGRALLSDPDWAVKVREDRFSDMTPFTKEVLGSLN
ncbi:MAG: NADH:flavin oxidoreductase [Pseudomonadales bacterium]|jgi:2,4-dienoyl-CoA reductase-like NADH-dependent reductase (Old Yellow Enzyme family)|nr:NADH:flavin oxidoreductase [Pseudomonadales bacterium]